MKEIYKISNSALKIGDLNQIINGNVNIELSQEIQENIQKSRKYLENKIKTSPKPVYGINTGFGSLYKHSISEENLSQLQTNLVMSHACGVGNEVPKDIIRLMVFLKIKSLSFGNSAVRLKLVQRLIDFYNNDILPIVYDTGSLGASGDLAPLAHIALAMIGMGEVYYKGEKMSGEELHKKLNWEPLTLQAKEGLALLNGTQFMLSYGLYTLCKAKKVSEIADKIAALSVDAFDGRPEPFDELIHLVRPHSGQIETAKNMRNYLEGSEIINQPKVHVQDPYSFRCVPQVHGASKDTLAHVEKVLMTEANSVTDNPNIFPDEDKIISGGNFHGQPLALALDFLAIAIAELGNISERRVYQMVNGKRGLPDFLVAKPGLNSGFMIPQYAAAAVVSKNKQLCTPSSVDSIESSNGQEDHVSMGANAATKALQVVINVETVLGVELFTSTQAVEFRVPLKTSPILEEFKAEFRKTIPFVENDKIMYIEMKKALDFIQAY